MTLIAVTTEHTTGATLKAWPAGSTSNGTLLTETATGLFTGTLDDAYGDIWYGFNGASTPTQWNPNVSGGPIKVFDLSLSRLATITSGGGTVTVTQPVSTDGNLIYPIVIGDDYLAANGRAFEWTIPAVAGFTVGSSTCSFGGSYTNKDGTFTWLVTGTVADVGGGNWKLSFDMAKTVTQDLVAAYYVWSVEVKQSGTEVTRVRSGKTVQLVEKQT